MPQLNQIGILSPRHPEEKLTIIIHQDHFGIAKIPCHPDQTADPHLLDFMTVQHIAAVKFRHAVQIMIYKLKIACKVITAVRQKYHPVLLDWGKSCNGIDHIHHPHLCCKNTNADPAKGIHLCPDML